MLLSDIQPGYRIADRYEIQTPLGDGGFSRVYKGVQLGMSRAVAIKVMTPRLEHLPAEQHDAVRQNFAQRFEQEAQVLSQLREPSTVTVHDYGVEQGVPYMILELVEGTSLEQISKTFPMEPIRVCKILKQVLQSLREAHFHGILHRDIKPANIMVFSHMGEHDRVKVLDFGMAKIYHGNQSTSPSVELDMLVGTPRYMAPELIREPERACPATDLYSVGLVCYEMLVGKPAYPGKDTTTLISAQLDPQSIKLPEDCDVPHSLREIVDGMLQKSLAFRWATTDDVLDVLNEEVLPALSKSTQAPSLSLNAPKPSLSLNPTKPSLSLNPKKPSLSIDPPKPSLSLKMTKLPPTAPSGPANEDVTVPRMTAIQESEASEVEDEILISSNVMLTEADEEEFVQSSLTIPIPDDIRQKLVSSSQDEDHREQLDQAVQEAQQQAYRDQQHSSLLPGPPKHSVARPLQSMTTSQPIDVSRFPDRKKIESAHNVAAPLDPLPLSWDDNEVTPPPPQADKQQKVIVLDAPSGRHPAAHSNHPLTDSQPAHNMSADNSQRDTSNTHAIDTPVNATLLQQQRKQRMLLVALVAAIVVVSVIIAVRLLS